MVNTYRILAQPAAAVPTQPDAAAERRYSEKYGMTLALLLAALTLAAPSTVAQNAAALFDRAQSQHRSGNLTDAEQSYRQYLKTYGAKPEVLANLGALLAQQDRFDEAVTAYQNALKLAPQLTPIHLNLGLAYFKSGKHDDASRQFSAFLSKDPTHRQARQLRAMSNLEAERFAEAAADYQTLLPGGDITIQLGLATAYTRMGETAKARDLMAPVLERENSAEIQILIAQMALMDDRPDDAQKAISRAAELNTRASGVHYYQGLLHWKRQEVAEAIAEWRRELDLNPTSFPATFALGGALSVSATSDATPATRADAEHYLRRAVAFKPRHAPALYQLAKLLWQSKGKETQSLLERAVAADPSHREAHYLLGSVYQASGRPRDAARQFATVKQLSRDSDKKYQELFDLGK